MCPSRAYSPSVFAGIANAEEVLGVSISRCFYRCCGDGQRVEHGNGWRKFEDKDVFTDGCQAHMLNLAAQVQGWIKPLSI